MYTDIMESLRKPMWHFTLLVVMFLMLAFLSPSSLITENIFLMLTHWLPYIIIWFAAFYAYDRLKAYSDSIKNSPESHGFTLLTIGCGWLAYVLPVSAMIVMLLRSISLNNPDFVPTATIISNYMYLVLSIVGFTILAKSARSLSEYSQLRIKPHQTRLLIASFALLGVIYCYSVLITLDIMTPEAVSNLFYLPIWLIVISLVIPYLYSWFTGLMAAFEFFLFSRHSKGVIYRKAILMVGVGIATVIAASIAVQYLHIINPQNESSYLNASLALSYLIGFIASLGFGMIAVGAIRLKRIEEA